MYYYVRYKSSIVPLLEGQKEKIMNEIKKEIPAIQIALRRLLNILKGCGDFDDMINEMVEGLAFINGYMEKANEGKENE